MEALALLVTLVLPVEWGSVVGNKHCGKGCIGKDPTQFIRVFWWDCLFNLSAKGKVGVMENLVSAVIIYASQRIMPYHRGEDVWSTGWRLWTDVFLQQAHRSRGANLSNSPFIAALYSLLDVTRMIRMKTMNSIRNSMGSWCQAQCQVWYAIVTEEMHCSSKWSFLSVNAACLHISNDYSPAEKWHSHE